MTAQRRVERLQDVPLSVTAIDASKLQTTGIQSSADLPQAVPGLSLTQVGVFVVPSLRGIVSSTVGGGADTSVPIYLDGVLIDNSAGSLFQLSDISNIQVLKGPQGTLYGRNATGGAILITTREPSFTTTAKVSASYARFNEVHLDGFVSGPLAGDVLAASLSANYAHRDGYVKDLLRGGHIGALNAYTVRGKLLFRPSSTLDVTLSGMHTRNSDLSAYAGIALGGNSRSRLIAPQLPIALEPFTNTTNENQVLRLVQDIASLNIRWHGDLGTLSSISAYQKIPSYVFQDSDQGPAAANSSSLRQTTKTLSEEVNFASRDFGAFSFIAGGSYHHKDTIADLVANTVTHIPGTLETRAFAAYAEGTLKFDRLSIIGGLRYTHERRSTTGSVGPVGGPVTLVDTASKSWNDVTPRATIQYRFSPHANVYVSYNQGFKSGSFAPNALNGVAVDPEKVTAYEAGVKLSSAGMSLNLAIYHNDYKNIQVSVIQGNSSLLQNAAAARTQGIDIDGSFDLPAHFKVDFGASYIDAKYTSFPNAVVNVPISPANCPQGFYPCGNKSATIDATGFPLPRVPKFTFNLGVSTDIAMRGGDLRPHLAFYHNSGFSFEAGNRVRQNAYSTLNFDISYKPTASPFEFALFGRNLTNTTYIFQEADSTGGDAVAFAEPWSVGARVSFEY